MKLNEEGKMRQLMMEERIKEGLQLAEAYKTYLDPMKEAMKEKTGNEVQPHMLATTAFALRSVDQWLASMDETTKAINAGSFADYGYKLVTAILPNLVADQVVSVQPLKVRTGDIFYFDFKYAAAKGAVAAGDTALSSQTGYGGAVSQG